MMTLEDKIRAATRSAADLVAEGSAPPLELSRVPSGKSRYRRARLQIGRFGMPLTPLAAATAVLLIAVGAIAISGSLGSQPRSHRPHPAVAASKPTAGPSKPAVTASKPAGLRPSAGPSRLLPTYLLDLSAYGNLDIRNAVTGRLTDSVSPPNGGYWYALAAQGPRTFIVAGDDSSPTSNGGSTFYRFVVGSDGKVASSRPIRRLAGTVMSASVTPNGTYIGYILMTVSKTKHGQVATDEVVLANLRTGKVIASWPVPGNDSIASLSIDAAGTELAISAYYSIPSGFYVTVPKHGELMQWTSVLRPATSGTLIDKLPKLLSQAGTLALSPDGRILYEFLQAGKVTGTSFRDPHPVTIDLAAVDASTGAVVSDLHAWRVVWADFQPQLALGPDGAYVLVADGTSLARINTGTGQYTTLGSMPSLELNPKYQLGQGGDIDPLAW
jgi:hypothetical protein